MVRSSTFPGRNLEEFRRPEYCDQKLRLQTSAASIQDAVGRSLMSWGERMTFSTVRDQT